MSVVDKPVPLHLRATRLALKAVPEALWRRLGRNGPVNRDGHRIAPEIAGVMRVLNAMPGSDFSDKPVEEARRQIVDESLLFADTFPEFAVIDDFTVPGPNGYVPVTRYRARREAPTGVIVYFHGGGWVLGDRVSTDSAVRFLAVHTGADVVSVDYRLAPEHPFPAGVEDALAAFEYVRDNCADWGVPSSRIVVAGDSAGANLSAVISQLLRDDEQPPMLQVLFSPAVDLSRQTASYAEFAEGFFLTRKQMDWYKAKYLSDIGHAVDPRVSPILQEDLTGLPPAYVGVAGFDPLRDEGLEYARLLAEAGNRVTTHHATGMIHPYINVTGFSTGAREAAMHAADFIRSALTAAVDDDRAVDDRTVE